MQTRYPTLVLCALLCISEKADSQSALDSTPANCNWNLVYKLFNKVATTGIINYGKKSASPPYNAVSYAGETECVLTNTCTLNDTSNLRMIAYYPADHRYDLAPLPVLLISHAGGFSGCSSMNTNSIDTLCKLFAQRGFVTFNIEYRRGRIKDTIPKYTSVQHMISMYRGCQDLRGAIRSIIKLQRNYSTLKLPFIIDTNKIFLGGASAGAVMSMNVAYFRNQQMIDTAFPTIPGTPKMKDALGPIDANFYYGDTTIEFRSKIKGVLSMWGGVPLPMSFENKQSAFFKSYNPADNPPLIGFHGLSDPVFPISGKAKQRVYFSPAIGGDVLTNYNKESFCLGNNIEVEGVAETPDLVNISAQNMYYILKKLGRLTEFYVDCDMKHGVQNDCDTCSFKNDFGTGVSDEKSVYGYIAQRTATFFQAVLNNAKPSDFANTTTMFVNCENKRVQCNYADNDNNCNYADSCVFTSTDSITQSTHYSNIKQMATGFIIYPNPVHDILRLKGINQAFNAKAFIIDITGQILSTGTINNCVYTGKLSQLNPGIYYLKIMCRQYNTTMVFIKE
jgi:Secretion system C-terminal sorting domain/alpha/beta hydrolase fold